MDQKSHWTFVSPIYILKSCFLPNLSKLLPNPMKCYWSSGGRPCHIGVLKLYLTHCTRIMRWIPRSQPGKSSGSRFVTKITSSFLWPPKLRKQFWKNPWRSLAEISKTSNEMNWGTSTTDLTVYSSFSLSLVTNQCDTQDFKHLTDAGLCTHE